MNEDLLLFVNQYNQEQDMKLFNQYHKLEYNNKSKKKNNLNIKNKGILAKYLYENLDKMDDTEIKNTIIKCLSNDQIKSLLLNFELENYKEKTQKEISLEDFLKKALSIIKRYHWKAGGFFFEDDEWVVHKSNSSKYEIKENELILENTINLIDLSDSLTESYLKNLENRLESIAENIEINLKSRSSNKSKIIYVLICATDKNKTGFTEVGL